HRTWLRDPRDRATRGKRRDVAPPPRQVPPKHPDPLCRAGLVFQRARITPAYGLLRGCGRRHGRRCRLSLLLRSYPVRWHRHSAPPPGGQPHSEGCSVIGSDGRTVTTFPAKKFLEIKGRRMAYIDEG